MNILIGDFDLYNSVGGGQTVYRRLIETNPRLKFHYFIDKEDDNASEVSEFQDTLSLGKNLEKNLDDVKAALEQVDAGTYGICSNCGKQIEEARLKLVPSATLCITCVKQGRAS